jgi:hypothetical protein
VAPSSRLVLVAVTIAALAESAGATPSDDVSIEYAAPEACPAKEVFRSWVATRTVRADIVAARPGLRRFVVAIVAQDGGYAGVLRAVDELGASSIRHLVAPSCADVALALALTTALAADASLPEPVPPPPPPRARAIDVSGTEAPRRVSWAMGIHAAATSGAAPDLLFGVPVFVEASLLRGTHPSARLAVEYTSIATDTAGYTRLTSRLDLCPVALAAGRLLAQPCAVAEAGALRVGGLRVDMPEVHTRAWVSLGGGARLALRIGRWMRLETMAFAGFPLVRDRFTVAETVNVHVVPAVTFSLSAGVAWTFP